MFRFGRFLGFALGVCWFITASAQEPVTAIRAGRLFDARSGTMLTNQTMLIRGDRIADVGANVAVPAGARVIDLDERDRAARHDRRARPRRPERAERVGRARTRS